LESYEDFEKWLVIVARNKFAMALRRAQVEAKHQEFLRASNVHDKALAAELERLGDETAEEVVSRLAASLRDQEEQTVFLGKLAGKPEAAIAGALGCSTRKVRGIWKKVKERLLKAAEDASPL
jgi:RNA polymerase sigma factor (sigma-70 family)